MANDRCLPPPRRTGRADFPHPALAKVSCQERSQCYQAQSGKVVVVAFIGGPLPAALTSSLEMLRQPAQHVGVNVTHGFAGITQTEVLGPTAQVAVEFGDQVGQRHLAAVESELLMEHGSFPSPSIAGS